MKTKFALRPPVISVLILVRIKLSFSPSSLVVYKESGAGSPSRLTALQSPGHPASAHTGASSYLAGSTQADREVRKSRGDLTDKI